MKKNAKIALAIIAVLCGGSASFISYDFSKMYLNPGLGISPQITPLQLARNLILPFVCIFLILVIPTLIPTQYAKSLKVSRVLVSVLAFFVSFLSSFITVPESLIIWYSIDVVEKLPMYVCEVLITSGTLTAGIILL